MPVQLYWTHLVPHPAADYTLSPKFLFTSKASSTQTGPLNWDWLTFIRRDYLGWFYFQLLDFVLSMPKLRQGIKKITSTATFLHLK